ncbi:MAG: SDR family oxidoreductase [Phycisphaerae bacterium]
MSVAIVGCGYVGSALGATLVRRGLDVVGTTTSPGRVDELASLGIQPVVLEVADVGALRSCVTGCGTLFLMVAPGGPDGDYRAVYLEGVGNLLVAAAGSSVRHIVLTSSTSVYGQDEGGWVDETCPTEPVRENSRILLEAERALLAGAKAQGMTATVLRLSGIVGPGRLAGGRAARYAGQERTDGEVYVNLIHRDDIVAACVALLDRPCHGVLNLSGDAPILRRRLYDRVIAAAGLEPIRWKSSGGASRGKRVANQRIKRELGLTLAHGEPWR